VPLPVEKQVLSLYVATSGLLDAVPVPEVRRFEREFLQFVETNHPSILKNIATKKALDDAIKAEVKSAVDAFKERFTAAVAAAAK
jgi:F-type H+-transporting ATPase subunit alpha